MYLQDNSTEYRISKRAIGYIKPGMTINELHQCYKNYEFGKAFNFEFDLDDEEEGILLIHKSDTLAFVWLKYNTDTIGGVSCLSERFTTDTGIRVGMSIADLEIIYSDIKVIPSIYDSSIEYIFIEEENIELVFLSNSRKTVGIYNNENELHNGTTSYDKTRKVDRINWR